MQKKIKLLHFIQNKIVIRMHLSFNDNENFINYYIVPTDSKNRDLIYSHRILLYKLQNANGLSQFLPNIKGMILKIHPDVIILSERCISNQYIELFKRLKIPIYYMHHGLWNIKHLEFKMTDPEFLKSFNIFYRSFLGYRNAKLLKKVSRKFYPLQGLTTIDYMQHIDLEQQKKNIHKNKKNQRCLLFISNRKKKYMQEYIKILPTLVRFAELFDFHIYLKLKSSCLEKFNNFYKRKGFSNLHKNQNITLIKKEDSLLYNYFFSDIIIVQTTGTSYIESLILNKPTILCQIYDKTDYMDSKKYSKLLIAQNINQLQELLKQVTKKNIKADMEYQKDRQDFLKENIGLLENASEKIQSVIYSDFMRTGMKKNNK